MFISTMKSSKSKLVHCAARGVTDRSNKLLPCDSMAINTNFSRWLQGYLLVIEVSRLQNPVVLQILGCSFQLVSF